MVSSRIAKAEDCHSRMKIEARLQSRTESEKSEARKHCWLKRICRGRSLSSDDVLEKELEGRLRSYVRQEERAKQRKKEELPFEHVSITESVVCSLGGQNAFRWGKSKSKAKTTCAPKKKAAQMKEEL